MWSMILFPGLMTQVALAQAGDLESAWSAYEQSQSENFAAVSAQVEGSWEKYQQSVAELWGPVAKPSPRQLVDYSENKQVRVSIDYESGEVSLESLISDQQSLAAAQAQVKKTLSQLIKDPQDLKAEIKKDELVLGTKSLESYVTQTAEGLERVETRQGGDGKKRELYRTKLNLVSDLIQRRAQAIYPVVKKWSEKYSLDPAYVLAVIRQESAFNPRARSWVPAYGLMQIVPQYAGLEVSRELFGEGSLPSAETLYDVEKNIMMGTTYLKLLRDQYFSAIADQSQRQDLVTCGYNWGPHRLQKALREGRLKIAASREQLVQSLQAILPGETRDYLQKVSQYHLDFKKMMEKGKLVL